MRHDKKRADRDGKAEAVTALTKSAPERIWLQISDDEDHHAEPFPVGVNAEITWCQDSVLACEVEYMRADIHAAERQRAEQYRKALVSISGLLTWNECATATPQVRLTKAEISNALDSTINFARAALEQSK